MDSQSVGTESRHSEECRDRIEQTIANDVGDERSRKAKVRIDHYMEQKFEDGEYRSAEKENDPRGVSLYPQHTTRLARRDRHPRSSTLAVQTKATRWRVLMISMMDPLQ